MKKMMSLLCVSAVLCFLFLSSSYASSTADETVVPDAPAAVAVDSDQADQPMEMATEDDEEAGEALHVKASGDMEEKAAEGEDVSQ